jgi:aerobic-type carbon monoxide dehydrogenase small subunit (CoxS/CutS family)
MGNSKELTGCGACSGYGVIVDGKKCPICLNGVVEVEEPKIFDTHKLPESYYKRFHDLFSGIPIIVVDGKRGYFVEIQE